MPHSRASPRYPDRPCTLPLRRLALHAGAPDAESPSHLLKMRLSSSPPSACLVDSGIEPSLFPACGKNTLDHSAMRAHSRNSRDSLTSLFFCLPCKTCDHRRQLHRLNRLSDVHLETCRKSTHPIFATSIGGQRDGWNVSATFRFHLSHLSNE